MNNMNYNKQSLTNDLEAFRAEITNHSKYVQADSKTVQARVKQLFNTDSIFYIRFNLAYVLINSPDYAINDAVQREAKELIELLIYNLFVDLPKTQQAGLYLSLETAKNILSKINA
jgi:hypothetical protein